MHARPSTLACNSLSGPLQPPHWPPSVQYITHPRYHTSVPPSTRALLAGDTTTATRAAANLPVRIKRIADPRYPACGQHGLFARRKIAARSHIIDYVGEVHCEDRPDSDYDVSLHRSQDGANVGVDASAMGNESRFINDYRGVKDRPNAEFVEHRTAGGELRMGIWSTGEVRKGDEILVSYGKSWWRSRS